MINAMYIQAEQDTLMHLRRINIVLGKNGCGKSTLLKALDRVTSSQPAEFGHVRYITPERGGVLTYDVRRLACPVTVCLPTGQ